MSKTRDSGIKIWFWRRGDHTVPPEISHGPTWRGDVLIDLPNPSWGDPAAYFPLDPTLCNYNQYFNAHVMVFDLTFCVRDFLQWPSVFSRTRLRCAPSLPQGDWAGSTWGSSGCGTGTCENCECPLNYDGQFQNSSAPVCQWSTISPPLLARPIGKSIAYVYIPPYFRLPVVATSLRYKYLLPDALTVNKHHLFRRLFVFAIRSSTSIAQLRLSYQTAFELYGAQKGGE